MSVHLRSQCQTIAVQRLPWHVYELPIGKQRLQLTLLGLAASYSILSIESEIVQKSIENLSLFQGLMSLDVKLEQAMVLLDRRSPHRAESVWQKTTTCFIDFQ